VNFYFKSNTNLNLFLSLLSFDYIRFALVLFVLQSHVIWKVRELVCTHEAGAVFDAGGLQSVLMFIRTPRTQIHKDTLHSAMVVVSKLCTKVEPIDSLILP